MGGARRWLSGGWPVAMCGQGAPVGPQGGAGLGGGGWGLPKSQVDGEGGVEAAARLCSEAAAESGSRGGRR
jgi:hypothetical protein